MAQRKSKRRSSIRSNAFLDDNTDILDNGDPLWFDRTPVRPSKSMVLTEYSSSVLDSSSIDNGDEISHEWFKNLTTSETSITPTSQKKNIGISLENAQNSGNEDLVVESNSDQEFKKTRLKFGLNKRNINKTDNSNTFLKVLQNSKDSSTTNLINKQMLVEIDSESINLQVESSSDQEFKKTRSKFGLNKRNKNKTDNSNTFLKVLQNANDSSTTNLNNKELSAEIESESTNDDSKTIKKPRPFIFKTKKSSKDNIKNFDNVLYNENVSEKNSTNKKISIESSSNDNTTITRSKRKLYSQENQVMDVSINNSKQISENMLARTQSTENSNINAGDKLTKNLMINRRSLFLQESIKSNAETHPNLFDTVFQNHNESHSKNETFATESNKSSNNQRHINESENLSMNTNAKTKSLSELIQEDDNKSEKNNKDTLKQESNSAKVHRKKTNMTNDSQNPKENNSNLEVVNSKVHILSRTPSVKLQKLSTTVTSFSKPKNSKSRTEDTSYSSSEKLKESANEKVINKTKESIKNVHTSNSVVNINKTSHLRRKSTSTDDAVEDLLRTPHPAQSTLNPTGKPLTRITQFSLINDIDEGSLLKGFSDQLLPNLENLSEKNKEIKIPNDKANEELDETHNVSLKIQQQQNENSTMNLLNNSRSIDLENFTSKNISMAKQLNWIEVRKKVDLIKEAALLRFEYQRENQKKREDEKKRIEAKVMRSMALKQAALRKKQKKINKAFFVDGQLYKPPKLPKPRPWVTQRLYKYLWKCMEHKFGLRTRIESETFIKKLSDVYTIIIRRKKYENYVGELNGLLKCMAKLKIIKSRYDFYRFCSDFLPYNFNIKVVPMQLPGNKMNIPYEPRLLNETILKENSDFD